MESERTTRGTDRHRRPGPADEVVVVAGGDAPRSAVARHLPPDAVIVAADSGWDRARILGLVPHVLVGDLDSISPEGLDEARRRGVLIESHPADKDFTDTELALRCAADIALARLTLVAGGDRVDHLFGALAALADPRWHGLEVRGFVGSSRLHRLVAGVAVELRTRPGATLSILALGGPVEGVRTTGLRWHLDGERLEPWESRGMSNEATAATVRVSIDAGTALVLEPGFLDGDRNHQLQEKHR